MTFCILSFIILVIWSDIKADICITLQRQFIFTYDAHCTQISGVFKPVKYKQVSKAIYRQNDLLTLDGSSHIRWDIVLYEFSDQSSRVYCLAMVAIISKRMTDIQECLVLNIMLYPSIEINWSWLPGSNSKESST